MKFMPRARGPMFWFFGARQNLTRPLSSAVSGTISDALSAQESSQKSEVRMGFIFLINFISIYGESVWIVSFFLLPCFQFAELEITESLTYRIHPTNRSFSGLKDFI